MDEITFSLTQRIRSITELCLFRLEKPDYISDCEESHLCFPIQPQSLRVTESESELVSEAQQGQGLHQKVRFVFNTFQSTTSRKMNCVLKVVLNSNLICHVHRLGVQTIGKWIINISILSWGGVCWPAVKQKLD